MMMGQFKCIGETHSGRVRLRVYSGECAICRGRFEFTLPEKANPELNARRRCEGHRIPGAAVGSKAEAIAIATHGWRVVVGSELHQMREEGLAWKAIVTVVPPDGHVSAARPYVRVPARQPASVRDLPLNEVRMARRIRALGPLTAPRAAQMLGMTDSTARVYAARLVERGLFKRVSRGVFDLTEEGQRFFAPDPSPGPLIPMDLYGLDDEPVMGLFD